MPVGIEAELGISPIDRLLKTLGQVNCTKQFGNTTFVIDGFSEVLELVFGEVKGRGSRSAIGDACRST